MPQPVPARPASQPPGLVGPVAGQDASASPGFEEMLRVATGDVPAPPVPGRGPGSVLGSVLGRAVDLAPHDRGRELGLFRNREAPGDEQRTEEAPDRASHSPIATEPVAAAPGQPDAGGATAGQEASWAWPAAEAPLPVHFAAYVPTAPFPGAPAPTPTPPSLPDGSQARAAAPPLPAGAAWSSPPAPTSAPHPEFGAGAKTAAAFPNQGLPAVVASPLAADPAVVPPNGALTAALPLAHQPARGAAPVPSGNSQATGLPAMSDVPRRVGAGMSGIGITRGADRPAPAPPFTAAINNARMPTPMLLHPAGPEGDAKVGAETGSLLVQPAASRLAASPNLDGLAPNSSEKEAGRSVVAPPSFASTGEMLASPSNTGTAALGLSASMTPPSVQPGAEPGAQQARQPVPPAMPQPAFAAAPAGVGIERDLGRAAPAPAARAPRIATETATGDPVQFAARDGAEEFSFPTVSDMPGTRLTSASPVGASPVGADLADAGFQRVPGLVERDVATAQKREAPADVAAPVSQPEGVLAPAGAPHVQAPHAAAPPAAPAAEAAPVPSVADQVAPAVISMAQGRINGRRLSVSITPDELGQVSITVERAADGTTAVHVSAERAATLDLLRRDQADLARALDGAGASSGSHSLSFSLSGGDGRMPGGGGRNEPPVERQPASAAQLYAEAPPPVLSGLAAAHLAAARGGLDLTA